MKSIVDSFAGGGGASTGIEMALGRSPDLAINHDPVALAMHEVNHPETKHLTSNIYQVDPLDHFKKGDVGLAWFSPDCKHFSKAKGAAPVKRNIRDLAWVVVEWAKRVRPDVIMLENVEEFLTWGPVDVLTNKPIPERAGETWTQWVRALRAEGYKIEWRELRACDYGAPTIRKRLFVVARCDGQPIVWPEPTHGAPSDPNVLAGKQKPWRTAAEIIDWSLPCPSIFDTREEIMAKHGLRAQRPLADATLRRVAKGVMRYVVDAAEPFIVSVANSKTTGRAPNFWSKDEPTRTQTTSGSFAVVQPSFMTYGQHGGGNRAADEPHHTITASTKDQNAVVVPSLIQTGYGERPGQDPRVPGLEKPIGTMVAGGGKHALVSAFLAQHNGGVVGHDARKPISTITQRGTQQQVVAAHMVSMHGANRRDAGVDAPLRTITAGGGHATLVAGFLQKYYGNEREGVDMNAPMHTVTTKDRFGLVTVEICGVTYAIVDIGMRMLVPQELFRAQGFPESYIIDRDATGRPFTKTEQTRMCGNSVCPPLSEALVRANCPDLAARRVAA